uniref:Uncharacterized protein n=1 Tax=Physcomitrium patens TaxID=3218 RepID=A0A2K1JU07_PHYPA|nr:hypothetical protein PHYPA_014784 [Physcomitrium patens]
MRPSVKHLLCLVDVSPSFASCRMFCISSMFGRNHWSFCTRLRLTASNKMQLPMYPNSCAEKKSLQFLPQLDCRLHTFSSN